MKLFNRAISSRGRPQALALTLLSLILLINGPAPSQSSTTNAPQAQQRQTAQQQAASPAPERVTSALRIRAWPKVGGETVKLDRKRFFLIKGSLAENRALVERMSGTPLLSRDCYYRGIGASEALIKWLDKGDCESVYCREVVAQDLSGSDAVPEFQLAYERGRKEFGRQDVALRWLAVNLREDVRSGFYRRQQESLRALLRDAESASRAAVQSVMTDRKGSAYFTDVEPGKYVVSNLLPAQVGSVAILWNCEVEIKPKELSAAMKRPFMLTNDAGAANKCFVERPLPACPAQGK